MGAGAPDTLLRGGHASGLAKGVQRAVARGAPPAQLHLIVREWRGQGGCGVAEERHLSSPALITRGAVTDAHAGALPKLLQRYPGALVRAWGSEAAGSG